MLKNKFGDIMKIVAIDQSLTCSGMCCLDSETGIIKTAKIETKKLRGVKRLAYIRTNIFKFFKDNKGDFLAIEGYSFGSRGRAIFDLGELGGMIKLTAFDEKITLTIVTPGQWKKALFGKGTLKKDMVLKETLKRFNFDFQDDNVCDSFCIAKFIEQYFQWKNDEGKHRVSAVEVFKKFND